MIRVGRWAAVAALAARLSLPAGEITVGDPVILKLTVTHPPGTVFDFPDTAQLQPSGRSKSIRDAVMVAKA